MTPAVPCREWLLQQGFSVDGITDAVLDESEKTPAGQSLYRLMPLPSMIVVHHSATDSGSTRLFRCLHRAVNGWTDIGYHFVIGNGTDSGDGVVETGRPLGFRGAHAKGSNHCSIGVCLVGNFQETWPTERQTEALGRLLDDLLDRFRLGPGCVLLHREVHGCRTVCPGENLTRAMVLESRGRTRT